MAREFDFRPRYQIDPNVFQDIPDKFANIIESVRGGVKRGQEATQALKKRRIMQLQQEALGEVLGGKPVTDLSPEHRMALLVGPGGEGVSPRVEEQVAKMAFPTQPKGKGFQSKAVTIDGIPAIVNYESGTGKYYNTDTGEEITGKIKPYSPGIATTPLTEADRRRLSPLARAVIEGRATPQQITTFRGEDREKLAMIAAEIDPNFDLSLSNQRIQMRREYTPAGKTGQALLSINTVIGHLDTLYDKVKKLDNKQVVKYNTVSNYARQNAGKPEVAEFNAAMNAVVNELGKIFKAGVVTESEVRELENAINSSSSPEQARGVIETWIHLMKSRTDSYREAWDQALPGVKTPIPIINEKAKKSLIKHGYDPDTLEQTGEEHTNKINDFSNLSDEEIEKRIQSLQGKK